MDTLRGKVIWITGASSGIGEALAYECAGRGAELVLSARREVELNRVKSHCIHPDQVIVLPIDLTNGEEVATKVNEVISLKGRIDIVINCAGVSQRSYTSDTSMAVYRRIFEINFFSIVQHTLSVLPHFKQQNKGMFVAISSLTGISGLPLRSAYSASKHAVEGFFSTLRAELWKTNIKIVVVRPGAIKTNIAKNALTGDGSNFNKNDKLIDHGMEPARCAKAIVKAILAGKKEVVVGSFKEKTFVHLNKFFPSLIFHVIKRVGE